MRRPTAIALAGLVAAAMAVTAFTSADDEQTSRAGAATTAKSVIDVSAYVGDGRTDAQAIQAAIDDAHPGDTVAFPAGTYELDEPIRLKSGIDYLGDAGHPPRLVGVDRSGVMIEHTAKTPLRNVTIKSLTFDNVGLRLTGAADTTAFSNISIVDSIFVNGAPTREWEQPYIELTYTEGVTVDGCQFLRDEAHGGRGIVADRTQLTVIVDSYFGTTPGLEPGVPNGYFRTAINVYGHDLASNTGNREVVIDGNVMRRTPAASNPEECWFCQDHGIYAWGSQRLTITDNQIDGWDVSSAGGAIKVRNQESTFIRGNRMKTSGVLTYVYDSSAMPLVLDRIAIRDNVIDLDGQDAICGSYCGISYWRDFADKGQFERDIVIADNHFTDGGSITVSRADGTAFCIRGNVGAATRFLSKGIRTTDCASLTTWDDPLAGVHRGDFNGDGIEDFVHVAHDENGEGYWRAHISSEHGFNVSEWGRDIRTSKLTAGYGVHVADFDGDGDDDLLYFGYCQRREACWRLNVSDATAFARVLDFGDGIRDTAETVYRGVHAGDFDGDGRADLAVRGECGKEDSACWQFLRSTVSGFAPIDGGNGAGWGGAESKDFGIVIGDYDGDGADDLAYRGVCGAAATPCFRVHLGSRTGFRAREWGDNAFFADVSAHFGMHAGDVNGDDRADIGYLGGCGDTNPTRWRYHVSTGSGFTVECSNQFLFTRSP